MTGEGLRCAVRAFIVLVSLLLAADVLAAGSRPRSPPAFASSKALLGKPGGTGLIRADEVTYNTKTKFVTAEGHVEIDYNGRILLADKVTYDQDKDVATADGHVSLLEPNGTVAFSTHTELTNKMRDGIAEAFSAIIGKTGRMAANRAIRSSNGTVVTGLHGVFSSCKVCDKPGQRTPLWQVKAVRVVWDEVNHRIIYHDATLEMFGVPVAYTPYFSQADPTVKHKSGLLMPELGHTSVLGSLIRLPIYVALSDSQDLTLMPMLTSRSGELLEGEYRQRWDDGGMWLQGAIAYNPHGGLSENQHEWYSSVFGSGRIPLASNIWHFGYDVQYTSNDTFLKRYDISFLDRLTSDLFVEGIDGRSRLLVTGYYFEGLRLTDNQDFFPVVLPLIEYTYIPEHEVLGGEFRFDASSAVITPKLGPQSQRATGEIRWRLPLLTSNGQLITIQADARGDIYRVTNNDLVDFPDIPTKVHYIGRGLPYVALDWRWPFAAANGDQSYVFEPIAQLIAAPYGGNPEGIPNEDSTDFELDDNNIFTFEHLPGYDLVETGPRANAGFRATAFFPAGSTELLIGEAFRLKPDPTFGPVVGLDDTTHSDLIGRFTIKFPRHFSLTERADIDQESGHLRRNEVYIDGTWGRSQVEVSYLRLDQQEPLLGLESREEVNGQATMGIFEHWLLFAGARRDIENDRMIDDEFGLGYDDECFGISVSYRRNYTTDRDLTPSTSILFRLNLKTGDQKEQSSELFPRHVFTTP